MLNLSRAAGSFVSHLTKKPRSAEQGFLAFSRFAGALVSALVPALGPVLIGSLLAFAPVLASFILALVRLLFVPILTFLLAPLTIALP
jgi:hypothetical protein